MKHVCILVPAGDSSISNIEGTHQIFTQVNSLLKDAGQKPLFTVNLVGLHKEQRLRNGLFAVYPELLITDDIKSDLLIIPALFGDIKKALKQNAPFLPWILLQYKQAAEIACLCHGSFLLAATGLLKGRRCATHWAAANYFRRMFPDVMLLPDEIITDDHGLYSSGGAYSSLNLILYLVEKYSGRDVAIRCAKIFEIDFNRKSQSPFIIFSAEKNHDDELIKKVQTFIENHFAEKISVDELAAFAGLSRRNLERRFRKATFHSLVEYLQRARIEAAKKILEKYRVDINEAMLQAGYSDFKAFSATFKKLTGLSPIAYSNSFNGSTSIVNR
jgi:transcriptional regulator GlxA family with amidase domain